MDLASRLPYILWNGYAKAFTMKKHLYNIIIAKEIKKERMHYGV